MAFSHSKRARLWINGYELTNYFNDFSAPAKAGLAETTVYGRGAKTYIGGLKEGSITAKGFFGAAVTDVQDSTISASLGNNTNASVVFSFNGLTAVGTRVSVAYAALVDYNVSAPVTGAVATNLTAQADSGLCTGVVLWDVVTAINTIAVLPGTGVNDTGSESGFSTNNGLVADIELVSITGTSSPSITAVLQSSDDNSTWVTLGSFNGGSPMTAIGGYQLTVPMNTTINRYLRVVLTTAGATISATALVAAARQ